jgi:hypothetical protein
MTASRRALCVAYGAIGLVAFIGTWGNVLGLLREHGFVAGTLRFWQEALATDVSRFVTLDLLFLGLAVAVWMVLEARLLTIPGVWIYVIAGLLIAISLSVPLFLIHREIRLAALEPGSAGGTLRRGDLVGLGILGLAFIAYAIAALSV